MAYVNYHTELFEEFISPVNRIRNGLSDIILNDFRRYIESDFEELPSYFGFESMYGSPPEIAGVMFHIHLCIPPDSFPKNRVQQDRKCKKGNPDKDIALVYTQGVLDIDSYCILAILMPDAHKKANDNKLMLRIGRYAREFRGAN